MDKHKHVHNMPPMMCRQVSGRINICTTAHLPQTDFGTLIRTAPPGTDRHASSIAATHAAAPHFRSPRLSGPPVRSVCPAGRAAIQIGPPPATPAATRPRHFLQLSASGHLPASMGSQGVLCTNLLSYRPGKAGQDPASGQPPDGLH